MTRIRLPLAALTLAASGTLAHAHHPMGGETPATLTQGLLSGFGHPVIGVDHLAFIVAIGIAAGLAGRPLSIVGTFVAASLAGLLAHVLGFALSAVELMVAASVLLAGIMLATRTRSGAAWMVLGLAGIFHGQAYAEAVIGAEPTPIAAYLVGLTLVQGAIGVGAALAVRAFDVAPTTPLPRVAGVVVAAIGVVFLAL